ncbi:MAG: magnesium/cobalt transporter CorA [Flavobacteriales bacterium]|nr:magnesium/cobalt transporter CorA [Flavobacteriales bacterium]
MTNLLQIRKRNIGRSPDDLYFRGGKKADSVRLRLIDFNGDILKEDTVETVQEVLALRTRNSVTWLNVDGIHDPEVMDEIAKGFELDRLILADVMNTEARPKVQEHSNCVFVSIRMLQHNDATDQVEVENLSIVLTRSTLISFQERAGDVFEPIRERIRAQKKRIRNSGTDYLAFALLDIVVDNYILVTSMLGEKIDDLEDTLLSEPTQSVIDRINTYKSELNLLRKNINPAKEMIQSLSKLESDLIEDSTDIFLKELENNINQATESANIQREILSDQLTIYHTTISSKLNDIMKFLTVFSVIFIPLSFIAGIYGTNFDVLPELHYRYSYYIMLCAMGVVAISMLIYFKRKKWL